MEEHAKKCQECNSKIEAEEVCSDCHNRNCHNINCIYCCIICTNCHKKICRLCLSENDNTCEECFEKIMDLYYTEKYSKKMNEQIKNYKC